MARLRLSLAISDNVRTRPIIDGTIKPDGIDLDISVLHGSEIFYRQLHYAQFDLSEMSLSSLIMATANGDTTWTGLPIFASRRFFHTEVMVREDSGINTPADLKGRKVGVPEYQQTAALWSRAGLSQLYGVRAQDMEWWMERYPEKSHGAATGFKPPEGVVLHYMTPNESLASMMLDGQLEAAIHYVGATNLVDRSAIDLAAQPGIRYLFPDPKAEAAHYYRETGFFPINHGMVLRRSIYEQQPWVALNIYNAFFKAKEMVRARTRDLMGPYFETGLLASDGQKAAATDLFAYGVRENRKILEAIPQFSHEQGLTPRVVRVDEIFAKQTLDI